MNQVPTAATTPAMTGDISAGRITLPTTPSSLEPSPFQLTPRRPSPAIVAPIRPPNSACEEHDGRPSSQVKQVPEDPADEAGQDDQQQRVPVVGGQLRSGCAVGVLDLHHGVGDGERDLDREERADEVQRRGEAHRDLGPQRAGGDRGRHRVAGVVEAVGEVEGQGGPDHQDQDEGRFAHGPRLLLPRAPAGGPGAGVQRVFTLALSGPGTASAPRRTPRAARCAPSGPRP